MPLITLTTDLGTRDTYVAQMKGVILGIAPNATIIDITHELPPQDILAGALALESAFAAFPPGTIHVAVVDPGVGSDRRAIAARTANYTFIGPDNGLFTLAFEREPPQQIVNLTNPRYHRDPVSPTFHGRDIFAPVAAHLANGTKLNDLGQTLDNPIRIDIPQPQPEGQALVLHVLTTDRFGNLITDLTEPSFRLWLNGRSSDQITLHVGDTAIRGLARTFADVGEGQLLAYFGSGRRLEIAARERNAADMLGSLHDPLDSIRLIS